ncbi:MAG: AAA family ATPase, partial [Sulfurovaceae bacterium]|nr:AAA family ATPase [Sulfurovaceae bacterium]
HVTNILHLIEKIRDKKEHLILLHRQKNSMNTLLINDSTYGNILKQLKESQKKLTDLRLEYTRKHPKVKKNEKDINTFKLELNNYLKRHINSDSEDIIRLKRDINKILNALISSVGKEYSSIKKLLEKDKISIDKLPQSTMKLKELKREFKFNENNYQILLQKKSESLLSKELISSNIQIVDNATFPIHPIKPKKSFLYLSSLILGLFLSIIYTSFRIHKDKSIYNKNDILLDGYSLIYDEKRELKDNVWTLIAYLEGLISFGKSKIIFITANNYEENKSFITKELSLALVNISKKVLIIDFDVYHPNLSASLNRSESIGLSTLLTSKHNLDEIDIKEYVNYKYENIDILSSGSIMPNGSSLLFNSKIKSLLELMSKEYDYILIDAPPIGKYPVSAILLKHINIFLVVAKMKKTNKVFFEKLNEVDAEDIEKVVFLID